MQSQPQSNTPMHHNEASAEFSDDDQETGRLATFDFVNRVPRMRSRFFREFLLDQCNPSPSKLLDQPTILEYLEA